MIFKKQMDPINSKVNSFGHITHVYCPKCNAMSEITTIKPYSYCDFEYGQLGYCHVCQKGFMMWYDDDYDKLKPRPTAKIPDGIPKLKLKFVYPFHIPKVHKDAPEKARKAYEEGVICLNVNANNAAVTMFRKALQIVCIDKGAKTNENLVNQIKILPKDLEQHATELREWGNIGAHDKNIENAELEDAKMMKKFLETVFSRLYEESAELEESKKKRKVQN